MMQLSRKDANIMQHEFEKTEKEAKGNQGIRHFYTYVRALMGDAGFHAHVAKG
jgi:hypothetical protein